MVLIILFYDLSIVLNITSLFFSIMNDLKETYESKFKILPERLSEYNFLVNDSIRSEFNERDQSFINSLNRIASNIKDFFNNSYFIVDVGSGHLPGVAYHLLLNSIDCYFMIKGESSSRLSSNLVHFKELYGLAKKN